MGFADRNPLARNQRDRGRDTRSSRYQSRPLYSDRRPLQNPYAQNQGMGSRFGFGSRTSQAPAPLFHSTLDDFREEDDADEHARNVAEYYALQRSRRQVGASQLTQSSEGSDGGQPLREEGESEEDSNYGRGRGIRSSWRGESTQKSLQPPVVDTVRESPSRERSERGSDKDSKGKGKLVDVELESSRRDSEDDLEKVEASDDYEDDDHPPPIQQFRTAIPRKQQHSWIPEETDEETALANPRPSSPDRESVPPSVAAEPTIQQEPRHDAFFGNFYTLMMAALVGSFVLSYLHNSPPDRKHPLGDTVYSTLRASFHLLGIDTLVAVIVAVLWLGVMRSALRPLVYLIIIGVPIILLSFAIYPLVASFQGTESGASVQERLMRLTAFLPAIMAVFWTIMTIRSRHAISRATDILSFSVKIMEASPTLILVGFVTLIANVFWTWMWILMFRRIFLGGHFTTGGRLLFIVDLGTWWLGAFFVFMFLWTQSVISGVQRATTAATVSQWYFHRNTVPTPSSRAVVTESAKHALTVLFGTICASTLFQLAVRLPLLLLPRRMVALVTIFIYNFFPTPIASLTNPLTLTYAAIHSEPLGRAARGLSNLSFISATSPTTTLTPSSSSSYAPLLPYRLSKLLLHATRYVTAFCLGIAAWVSMSRSVSLAGNNGVKGSLYAYVVGLLAGMIGWSILGAMEGVLGGVVDAVAVCWGTEVAARGARGGKAPERGGYCWEAADLFGEGR